MSDHTPKTIDYLAAGMPVAGGLLFLAWFLLGSGPERLIVAGFIVFSALFGYLIERKF